MKKPVDQSLPFMRIPENKTVSFHVDDYHGWFEQDFPEYHRTVTRYVFNIRDDQDGEVKTLVTGRLLGEKLFFWLATTKPAPVRNWFMRMLERMGIVKPLVAGGYRDFTVTRSIGVHGFPQYDVKVKND